MMKVIENYEERKYHLKLIVIWNFGSVKLKIYV
jgi:hypothetical protein